MAPSTEQMEQLHVLAQRANNHNFAGRHERARELWSEGIALAKRVCPPNSLVVANLLMDLSRSLLASTELDECASDEFYEQRKQWWREAWRHCEAAARIVRARMDAGTLQDNCMYEHEAAFRREEFLRLPQNKDRPPPLPLLELGQQLGYVTF